MNEHLKNKKYQILILILLLIFAALIAGVVLVSSSDEDDESISNNEPTSLPVSPPEVISDTGNVEDDDTDQDDRNDEDTSEEVVIPAFPSEDSAHPKQEETWKTYRDPLSGFEISYPSDWKFDKQELSSSSKYLTISHNDNSIRINLRETSEAGCGSLLTREQFDAMYSVTLSNSNVELFFTDFRNLTLDKLPYGNLIDFYSIDQLYDDEDEWGFIGAFDCEILADTFGVSITLQLDNFTSKNEFFEYTNKVVSSIKLG